MMKRHTLAFLMLTACSGGTSELEPARAAPSAIPTTSVLPTKRLESQPSIYELDLPLKDGFDRSIGVNVASGHPVLIAMFYASCAVACPVLIGDLEQTVAKLPEPLAKEVRVVLVSFDAQRDTPAKLRALAKTHRLDHRWTLAAAAEPDARVLASVLGIKYRKLDNGEFFHNAVVTALDREGRPIAKAEGAGTSNSLIDALR